MAKKKAPGLKKPPVKKVNPFELKFNKAKHDVLGKKKNAGGLGHPGLSKKRAHEQREKTLGVEHARVGVVNKIVDRRLGEKDNAKTSEEKASLRFAAERMKNFKKANKYNLNDDEDLNKLTHGGAALTSIQKYERTLGSDDEDDETGALGAEMVKFAHFGGGDAKERPKTRQDVIADLIAKTKQSRHEKQLVKEDQENATENLDEKYRKLLGKVQATFRPIGATREEVVEKDDYDKLAQQLKLDADSKATPAERTKSDEEKAADEKARLEELEATRLARMNAKENSKRHLPVDVDFDPDAPERLEKKKKARFELRFDESGQVMNRDKIEKNSLRRVAIDSDVSDEDEEADDEDDEEDLDDLINGDEAGSGEEDEEMDGEDEQEEDEDGEEEEDAEEEEETEDTPVKATKMELKEAGNSAIPFVFDFPTGYGALAKLLQSYGAKNVGIVLERLVKCHHPGLKEGNKDLMKKLFLYTLRFYDETSQQPVTAETVEMLGTLSKSLYAIMKFNIEYGVRCVRAFVRQNWKTKSEERRKKAASFSLISLLRLVASLFPVSDIWHPVCSPALLLATYSLGSGMIVSPTAVARQLLLLTTVTDFVEESRRYVPEVIGFIWGALTLAVDTQELAPTNAFPISQPHCRMLLIRQKVMEEPTPLKLTEIFEQIEDNDMNRCRILRVLLGCVRRLKLIYAVHEETFSTVFSPIVALLKKIPAHLLPGSMADDLEALIKSTEADCTLRAKVIQLSRIKTEKSMLKMLEPKFETHFDPERPRMKRDGSRKDAAAQNSKMKYLYKKEMRGAIRELRKDTTFLGRKQRRDVAAKDRDRRVKTKRLMSDLSSQQGEWNAEMRENGRKKKK